MSYLIIDKDKDTPPFITDYFIIENNYIDGMVVFNLNSREYTSDGVNWEGIEIDQL
jgi:hypothetical protein